jgi:hypothetical protein
MESVRSGTEFLSDFFKRHARRFIDVCTQVRRNRKFFSVAKNRKNALGNFAIARISSDKSRPNPISLQRFMQANRPISYQCDCSSGMPSISFAQAFTAKDRLASIASRED